MDVGIFFAKHLHVIPTRFLLFAAPSEHGSQVLGRIRIPDTVSGRASGVLHVGVYCRVGPLCLSPKPCTAHVQRLLRLNGFLARRESEVSMIWSCSSRMVP